MLADFLFVGLKKMESIVVDRYCSPLGELVLGSLGGRLCMCNWPTGQRRSLIESRLMRRLGTDCKVGTSDVIERAKVELGEYFEGKRRVFDVATLLAGTDFQLTVWSELMKIPYGSTISYAALALRCGNRKAVRAVASACPANPISIIVPCHRVIGSDNTLTGYGGGVEAKRTLLALEARMAADAKYAVKK